tara:strand:- start:1213 stop:1506 length:294 start_codon:yes stop_codon:yes gene_type:complete
MEGSGMAPVSTLPRKPNLSEKMASTLPNCARVLARLVLDNPERPDAEELIRAAMFIESLGYWKLAKAAALRARRLDKKAQAAENTRLAAGQYHPAAD